MLRSLRSSAGVKAEDVKPESAVPFELAGNGWGSSLVGDDGLLLFDHGARLGVK